jgi:sulfoxide reductase heme-binding subunit YedZ
MDGVYMSTAVWYLMRGSGVSAMLLLTGVVVLGILTSRKRSLPTLPRFATMELHRSVSLLAVVFLTVHVLTAVFDPYAQVRLVDVVVPFAGTAQALMLGLGTLALDMFAAVIVSSLLLRHISRATWRAIHWLGYGVWPLAFVHMLGMGSDSGTIWLRAIAFASLVAMALALAWRAGLTNSGAREASRNPPARHRPARESPR